MAVFTPIELDEISSWISQDFDIGQATELRGIHGGIENSSFFLDTVLKNQKQEFVLTIFERLTAEQLPYYLELMRHLAHHGIPVPLYVNQQRGRHSLEHRSLLHGQNLRGALLSFETASGHRSG